MGEAVEIETRTNDAERVVVTGAAGFIGSHLVESLASQGRDVVGFDNYDPYYDPADKRRNACDATRSGALIRDLDILDRDAVDHAVAELRPDVVVHLAAKAGVRHSVEHPNDYFLTNVVGSQNVLDACRSHGTRRLVMASTSSVYGRTDIVPFTETDRCDSPLHPYAASKRAMELMAKTYHECYGLDVTVTRLFTVFGPRGRPDMMPRLLLDSITSGREVGLFAGPLARDWTFVGDVIRALVAAIDRPLGFEILNVGRGRPYPLRDFIECLEAVSGGTANLVDVPRPPSEVVATHADVSKMRRLLDVDPSVDMADGVAALWEWWAARRAELQSST